MTGERPSRDILYRISCESVSAKTWRGDRHLVPEAHPDKHHFYWFNKGSGRALIDGVTRGFTPNSAFFLPAKTVFGFDLTPATSGWVVSIPVHAALPYGLPSMNIHGMFSAREDQATINGICDDIHRETLREDHASPAALICHAGLLAIWLTRNAPEQQRNKASPAQRLMSAFTRRLEERYATEDTASDYAAALSVTPTHLARVCRQISGKALTTLIQERKLLAAKKNLIESDAKIAAIAQMNGFGSPAYFTRLFSKKTGLSPREFRNQERARQEPGAN